MLITVLSLSRAAQSWGKYKRNQKIKGQPVQWAFESDFFSENTAMIMTN